ncbi:hypothetical protein FM104_09115 [Microbacterium esteraromaticum]|uniref:Uncharacterized protein n=2 Tax=Microbacterium esteraromaticum TaxID=57043 RepID=A0A1R4JV40_9MICO|nr:hypothetical protein FM104_09115 [Microbacterium esteraromaticum]
MLTVVSLGAYPLAATIFAVTAGIGTAPDAATLSALAFWCAQVALGIAAVGLGHLLRTRTPILAPLAAGLLLLSAFAHAASAGLMLGRAAGQGAADAWGANALAMLALVSLSLGTILLAVALFRSKLSIGWVGIVLLGWMVVEFGLSGMGLWAMLAGAAMLFTGFFVLAIVTARSNLAVWTTAAEMATQPVRREQPRRSASIRR